MKSDFRKEYFDVGFFFFFSRLQCYHFISQALTLAGSSYLEQVKFFCGFAPVLILQAAID